MSVSWGPYTRTVYDINTTKVYWWYRQKAPYVLPLPFDMKVNKYVPVNAWYTPGTIPKGIAAGDNPAYAQTYAKAYAKFKDRVSDAASLAVNVAERKEAMDMMAKRVMQIYSFSRALSRFEFAEAGRALGLIPVGRKGNVYRFKESEKRKRERWRTSYQRSKQSPVYTGGNDVDLAPVSGQMKKKTRPRMRAEDNTLELRLKKRISSFGDNYLEFHFGWEPLMKDIEATLDLYTNPLRLPYGLKVRAGASNDAKSGDTSYPGSFAVTDSYQWRCGVSLRAKVTLDNLNVFRLEQMGLLNPAVLLWEVVPFSFIVDWFVGVGDFLSTISDFAGLNLENKTVTTFSRYACQEYYWKAAGPEQIRAFIGYGVRRSLGFAIPDLRIKPLKWPSATRGATAISLLTGFFDTVQRRR